MLLLTKKVNDIPCYEKRYDIYERAVTFDGPPYLSNFSTISLLFF